MTARSGIPAFGATLSLTIVLAVPSFARGSSYSSTTTVTAPSNSNPDQPATETTTITTSHSGGSWQQSAHDAAHNAEVATEKAYNHVARDVKDISLEGRVMAVLRENKYTHDSDVHVTANNGVVTLNGQVPSAQNAERVQQVVASVYGVKTVNNDLSYPGSRGWVTPPDAYSTGVAHPAYSDSAPAENAPLR